MSQVESVIESQSESVSESIVDCEEQAESQSQPVEFVSLLNHTDYEILNVYPYTIRRKDNHYEVSEHVMKSTGYPCVSLNSKPYTKHRLIALQFLPNPDNLEQVDHISRDRTDYHLTNLRWVSHSTNQRNKTSSNHVTYDFVKEISDDAIKVLDYNQHHFEDGAYYYHDDKFYYFNGIEYRIMYVNEKKDGNKCVHMKSIAGKSIQVCYSKFKRLYNLI